MMTLIVSRLRGTRQRGLGLRRSSLLVAMPTLFLLAVACSDDSEADTAPAEAGDGDEASGSEVEDESQTGASAEEIEKWQTDLNVVGCYVGPVDGALGPQTEAAINAFQAAKGLDVDGLLGPQTEGALAEAVAAGGAVCTSTSDVGGGGDGDGPMVTLSSAGYGPKDFEIGSCMSSEETALVLAAEADNLTIELNAPDGTGTLAVSGGTESDGITLNGDVSVVSVGDDGSFTVTGVFGEPNNVGEPFTLAGNCA